MEGGPERKVHVEIPWPVDRNRKSVKNYRLLLLLPSSKVRVNKTGEEPPREKVIVRLITLNDKHKQTASLFVSLIKITFSTI